MPEFVEGAYEVTRARLTGLEKPMAYFFQTLEQRLTEAFKKRPKSLAGKYSHLVMR